MGVSKQQRKTQAATAAKHGHGPRGADAREPRASRLVLLFLPLCLLGAAGGELLVVRLRQVLTAHGASPLRRANVATFSRLYVKQHFDCIVFLYRPDVDTTKLGFAPHCQLIKRSGMVFSYWKMVNPMFLARSNYSGVVWHSEDISVEPSTYNPMHLFAFMRVNNLHSASPVVAGSMWKCMNEQGPQQTQEQHMLYGRLTSFIEIQVTAFDFVGWSCFWTMINPVLNTVGFAYDLCFYPLCGLRMGMLDTAFAAHNVGNTHETTNLEMGRQQMTSWLAAVDAAVDTFNVPCNSTNRFPFGYEGDFTQANSTLLLLPPTTAKS